MVVDDYNHLSDELSPPWDANQDPANESGGARDRADDRAGADRRGADVTETVRKCKKYLKI
jgi:hypothetical protein